MTINNSFEADPSDSTMQSEPGVHAVSVTDSAVLVGIVDAVNKGDYVFLRNEAGLPVALVLPFSLEETMIQFVAQTATS